MSCPNFKDSLLFFDLAGTLVERDARMPEQYRNLFLELSQHSLGVVLVTGQPRSDPQVEEVFRIFLTEESPHFVAYTTRGGCRWLPCANGFVPDIEYLRESRLSSAETEAIQKTIEQRLVMLEVEPLIPIVTLDQCAVRLNIQPDVRQRVTHDLARRLSDYQVVPEGRTSIFVMRPGSGKRRAVSYELKQYKPSIAVHYFGDEVTRGNDREVLHHPGVKVWAVGEKPAHDECAYVGKGPHDLFHLVARFLSRSLEP